MDVRTHLPGGLRRVPGAALVSDDRDRLADIALRAMSASEAGRVLEVTREEFVLFKRLGEPERDPYLYALWEAALRNHPHFPDPFGGVIGHPWELPVRIVE